MAPKVPLAPVPFMFTVGGDFEHYLLGDLLGLSLFSPLEGRQNQTLCGEVAVWGRCWQDKVTLAPIT